MVLAEGRLCLRKFGLKGLKGMNHWDRKFVTQEQSPKKMNLMQQIHWETLNQLSKWKKNT